MKRLNYISKTVWIVSLVSLFTDTASEMLYPIMPIYLKSIGFSIVLIGVLEGFAEALAGLSKGYFGKLSDSSGKRVPFVRLGYGLSAISKPMMAVFVFPLWIFFARAIDRFGKGIRTGARDAILSDEATAETKGKIFGFHRSMDTFGAVLGPVMALIYLHFYPQQYKMLFYVAFIPGLLAVFASFLLNDKLKVQAKEVKQISFFSFLSYWKTSPAQYRRVVTGLLAFALFNSSDVFLLLKAKQAGLNDTVVIEIYIFYNLVYALCAFPLGIFADKIGLKKMFTFGLFLFAIVYFGMAFTKNSYIIGGLFLIYGVYAAATEGISKAWISNISDKKDTATAIGTYSGFQSICALLASSFAGVLWYQFGANTTFFITGITTLLIIIYFSFFIKYKTI
ncbi:MFS transporter [Flavobacterium sp. GSP27]|uniref:MFS transporter n=1 Tax=Flavobacterium bomense TaxID=2497483 RepID=A0A432CLN2_9FLAO|nr:MULTISPECIES: MFS transporter [Flavobacterium]RTY94065.1 MFS transporter [Flavobacterium sp. GSN2]RTY67189.1 MFS transporter [Flavobacterium sp. LB2P53]RTY75467.1 MFS transporter [Flavobacterium sp. LS1R10]RTY84731.1 MFS transporter [Flavobacterium sp. ZB4P23]RTY91899.1 MFS transporter [Flavobacterium sp. RSP46]